MSLYAFALGFGISVSVWFFLTCDSCVRVFFFFFRDSDVFTRSIADGWPLSALGKACGSLWPPSS
jgi:hypothetical protein